MLRKKEELEEMSQALSVLCLDMIQRTGSGHIGSCLGFSDVITVLFSDFFSFNVKDPEWVGRDRFILSAGHASALLYASHYLLGYPDITLDDLMNFRSFGSPASGHPERKSFSFVEFTTGPLGQGLANAIGCSLALKRIQEYTASNELDHRIYVVIGDGCLQEGISYEAMCFAADLDLQNIIVLWDNNGITIDGGTSSIHRTSQIPRIKAMGWNVLECDGHDFHAIQNTLSIAHSCQGRTFISFETSIGKGLDIQNTNMAHACPVSATMVEKYKKVRNADLQEFSLKKSAVSLWRKSYCRVIKRYTKSASRQKELYNSIFLQYSDFLAIEERNYGIVLDNIKDTYTSSRVVSGYVLSLLHKLYPYIFLGGSCDLASSTYISVDQKGYIHYGVREHAMGAIMNGLSSYGFIPYGSTFLCFSDYLRPAIRLSCLTKVRVIYVFTHDSIGVGQDGPTHQPVEHISSLRDIPNFYVFRPGTWFEVIQSWEQAVNLNFTSTIILSRQSFNIFLGRKNIRNSVARGGYVFREEKYPIVCVILATGSELDIANQIAVLIEKEDLGVRVVSLPCFQLFEEQSVIYKEKILGKSSIPCFAIEAGIGSCWNRYIKRNQYGRFFGVSSYGVTGAAGQLYSYFGLSAVRISSRILMCVRRYQETKSVLEK